MKNCRMFASSSLKEEFSSFCSIIRNWIESDPENQFCPKQLALDWLLKHLAKKEPTGHWPIGVFTLWTQNGFFQSGLIFFSFRETGTIPSLSEEFITSCAQAFYKPLLSLRTKAKIKLKNLHLFGCWNNTVDC